jgi:hypothetical protein
MRFLFSFVLCILSGGIVGQNTLALQLLFVDSVEKKMIIHQGPNRYCLERVLPGGDTVRQLVDPRAGWMLTYSAGDEVGWAIKTDLDGLPGGGVSQAYGFAPPQLEIAYTGQVRAFPGGTVREAIVRQNGQKALAWVAETGAWKHFADGSFLEAERYAMLRQLFRQARVVEWVQISESGEKLWSFQLEESTVSLRPDLLKVPSGVEILDLSSMRKLMEVAQEQPHRIKAAKALMWSF